MSAIKLIPTIISSIKETMNAKSSNGAGSIAASNGMAFIILAGIIIATIIPLMSSKVKDAKK